MMRAADCGPLVVQYFLTVFNRRPVFGTPVWIGFSLREACAGLEHRGDLVAGRIRPRRKEDLIVDLESAVDDAERATASAIASRAQEETPDLRPGIDRSAGVSAPSSSSTLMANPVQQHRDLLGA